MATPFPLRPLATITLGWLLAHGTAHAMTDAEFLSANQAFKAAATNDTVAIDAAAAAFAELQKAEPTHPVPFAYGGAVVARRARTTMLPWRKIGFAEDGMASIDKGLALLTPAHETDRLAGTPVALLVKFTAANTFLAVPAFFNRGARGRKLLDDVLAHPALATSAPPFREAVAQLSAAHPAGAK